jgi:glycosyltransferase involved in cell wall biosynthesis
LIKVIHIISSLGRGGRERQLAGILKNTNSKAIVFNKSANSYEEEYNLTEKIFYLQSRNPISRFFQMLHIIKTEKPVIIWSWGGFEATFGLLLSILTPARHINGSIRHGIVLRNRKQLWRMFILHLSRHIVANSHAGLKANKLKRGQVLYNGLDDRFFEKINQEQFLAENPDIKQIKDRNLPVLISVANLVPYKDYFTVLKAVEQLKKDGIGFSYLIVGEGPNRQAIEQQIREKGLDNDVFLLGRRQDVKALLSLADIFIHSSKGEGCSNAILEAMAAGLPVISTDTGGTSEIVKEPFGLLYDLGDSTQLYQALQNRLVQPGMLKKAGITAKEYAVQNFSTTQMLKHYRSILETTSQS